MVKKCDDPVTNSNLKESVQFSNITRGLSWPKSAFKKTNIQLVFQSKQPYRFVHTYSITTI